MWAFLKSSWFWSLFFLVVSVGVLLGLYFGTDLFTSSSNGTPTATSASEIASGDVKLISSELSTSARNRHMRSLRDTEIHDFITPDNLTGKMQFLVGALHDESSEDQEQKEPDTRGGDDKPHIILIGDSADVTKSDSVDTSKLLEFNLLEGTDIPQKMKITQAVSNTAGDLVLDSLIVLATYMDVDFTYNGDSKTLRFVLATHDDYRLGDILMKESSSGTFRWFDTAANDWTTTRTDTVVQATKLIKDYNQMIGEDESMSEFPFMPIFAKVRPTDETRFDGIVLNGLASATSMTANVDFQMGKLLMLPGAKNQVLTDEELIQTVTLMTMMGGEHEREGGCQDMWHQKIDDFLANASEADKANGQIFAETDEYHHFLVGDIKFYRGEQEGRITVKDVEVCPAGGNFSEEDKADARQWGLWVDLSTLTLE